MVSYPNIPVSFNLMAKPVVGFNWQGGEPCLAGPGRFMIFTVLAPSVPRHGTR